MMGTAFRSSSILCGLACLLYFFLDPVASQGPCESDNLIVISSTGAAPVPSLQQPLCFGCFFFNAQGFSIFNPLGTEWSLTDSGTTTPLNNDTTPEDVTLSGINGSLLVPLPSSFLQFGTSQLRCSYTSPSNGDFNWIATLTQAVLNPPFILGVNADGESFGIEGETVKLNCSNEENPNLNEQFMWLDSEGEALDEPGIVRPHNLVLANVTRSQSGVYVCVVAFQAGGGEVSLSVNTTLVVQYPALILIDPFANPSSLLHTGSNLTLSCTFEGVPAPNVTWTVNGSEVDVDGNDRLSVQTDEGSTQLIFTPVMGGDNGMYACAVDNSIASPSVGDAINVIVQVPPEPVVDLNVVSFTNKTVTLEWDLGFDGNAVITQVNASYDTAANFASVDSETEILEPTNTMITFFELEPNTQYDFTVLAINAVGSSQPVTVQGSTLPNRPDPPTNVNVAAVNSTSLLVTWTEPSFDSNLQTDFMTYTIEYTVDDNIQMDTTPYQAESYTITDLMKGTYYSVRVSLNNSAGNGVYSSPENGRTAVDPPTAVTNPLVTSYPTALCASWGPPDDSGGLPIDFYRLELQNSTDATEEIVTIGADTRFYSFENLVANTSYIVIITASNAEAGFGEAVEIEKSTSNDFDLLETFTLTVGYRSAISVNVSWDPQEGVNEYRVQYRELGDMMWTQTSSCSCTSYLISGLESETEYEIRAILIGSNNCTRLSSPAVTATTREVIVEVVPSVEGRVFTGQNFNLTCRLDSGENAPMVMWNRTDGSQLPSGSMQSGPSGSVLVIPNPMPADSGDYICFSRDANYTFSLLVEDPPTASPSSSMEPTSEGLDIIIVIIIAVVAGISMIIFFIVLAAAIFVCCRNKSHSSQKYPLKKKGEKIWMDEGAGGFIPSTMNPNDTYRTTANDDIDAPIETGRRMTTDPAHYTAATSFMNNQNPEKGELAYTEVEHEQQENSSYPNKDNRVEYMTAGSSTFHGSRERILSATTTDV